MDENQAQAQLIAEQLGRITDSLNARLNAIEQRLVTHTQIDDEQKSALRANIADMRDELRDHEQRLRAATDGVTQFKVWSGLAAGGSGLMSIVALLKAFIP